MKVLFLGRADSPVLAHLRAVEDVVVHTSEPIDPALVEELAPDWVVSHGFRRIIRTEVLDRLPDRFVNLHISLLPWNRGADANLWSWVDDTPKGVTIHHIDPGMDTGEVIAQRVVEMGEEETLASSYHRLQDELVELFRERWPTIRRGGAPRRPQSGAGSFHRMADRTRIEHLLERGWETPVSALRRRR